MKNTICFLVFILPSFFSFGQRYSVKVDSLTQAYFIQLPKSDQKIFNKIIRNSSKINLNERIDSVKFDYAFINESYCSSNNSIQVIERYFFKGDSFSDKIIVNGITPKGFEKCMSDLDYYRIDTLFNSYNQLKSFQTLAYTNYQFWIHGCVVYENAELEFIKQRKFELSHTCQVQIMIDKINSKIIVSFQIKPDVVTFEVIPFDILGHCW